MSFTSSTQLEAVNVMLATIGEAPVNSLSGPLTSDASLAFACLNEFTKKVQSDGYPWNTDQNVTLLPDTNGNIYLATNTARIEINKRLYAGILPILRPQVNGLPQLWDRQRQTYNFSTYTQGIVADNIVYWLDWTQLPEAARQYVTIRASRVFADRSVGAETMHQYTQQDEMDAKRALMLDKVDMDQMNVLTSPDTASLLNRGNSGVLRF